MTTPDGPTEPLRKAAGPPAPHRPAWRCARCQEPVDPFGQGHYKSTCLRSMRPGEFHFCCPPPAGCELREEGRTP